MILTVNKVENDVNNIFTSENMKNTPLRSFNTTTPFIWLDFCGTLKLG